MPLYPKSCLLAQVSGKHNYDWIVDNQSRQESPSAKSAGGRKQQRREDIGHSAEQNHPKDGSNDSRKQRASPHIVNWRLWARALTAFRALGVLCAELSFRLRLQPERN